MQVRTLQWSVLVLMVLQPALAISAKARTVDTSPPQGVTRDLSSGASFTFEIGPNLPRFTFKVISNQNGNDNYGNAQSTVRDVEVFRGDSRQPLQHLTGCDLNDMEAPRAGLDWFRAEDVNFDGYRDIYLVTNWGATGNQSGCVWLYDPSAGRFRYSEDFSGLAGYRLDPSTKTISTFSNGGMVGMVHTAAKYKVENNRPVLIWSENQDWDFGKKEFHCVIKQRKGAKMATVEDQWGKWDSGEGPCNPGRLF